MRVDNDMVEDVCLLFIIVIYYIRPIDWLIHLFNLYLFWSYVSIYLFFSIFLYKFIIF